MLLRGASAGFVRLGRRGNRKETLRLLSETEFSELKN